jgi:hypothetical protein
MLLIDLFCGRGGWTKGFMARGWKCIGYDIKHQPDYPATFVQQDVMALTSYSLKDADFVVCSSPCEQFSVHCMKHFHPHPPAPVLGMQLFNYARRICEDSGKPFIMENVRCAERFVGKAVNHCGPFYLWGNAVPAVMPGELYKVSKGTLWGLSRDSRKLYDPRYPMGSTERRAAYTSHIAEIPLSVAQYVASCAGVR